MGSYSFLVFITQRLLWPLTTLGRTLDDATVRPYHGVRWLENTGGLGFRAHELAALPEGERILSCIQCGTCSGTCPYGEHMEFTPRGEQAWISSRDALGFFARVRSNRLT